MFNQWADTIAFTRRVELTCRTSKPTSWLSAEAPDCSSFCCSRNMWDSGIPLRPQMAIKPGIKARTKGNLQAQALTASSP
eukprot:CAMPEP_0177223080 /NCGR_PEP_ID=MMETSP0367-20130122/38282_1 /TAXON_ID=447022 ORGANISM="Scrippsiella hangoei-like, Strain SHHI-4" /NCGR_SAMPLE_ID=MMETSP0367 /ASSEMBLY_ACC=CAM_ASM_000362 /LENGTH=79 /DNA_ID=CAMNT_0018673003 /DNA_START=11 /DNA_END=247 /DNA_ORIENTATION=+